MIEGLQINTIDSSAINIFTFEPNLQGNYWIYRDYTLDLYCIKIPTEDIEKERVYDHTHTHTQSILTREKIWIGVL